MMKKSTITVAVLAALTFSTPALAAKCSNTSGNFSNWVVQFKKEAFYGEVMVVKTAIQNISRVSFDMLYQLISKESGEEVAVAKTALILFDYKKRKDVQIPQQLLDLW